MAKKNWKFKEVFAEACLEIVPSRNPETNDHRSSGETHDQSEFLLSLAMLMKMRQKAIRYFLVTIGPSNEHPVLTRDDEVFLICLSSQYDLTLICWKLCH